MIAQCRDASDVATAVRFAREHDLPVAVRGGGHNVAGTATCDGGLLIDLAPMKAIRVDPARRLARAEPGLLWGEFDAATQAYGLAAPGGIVSHTGVAGLTLGGGIGWLMRKHGLTADNLRSADLVTAEGRFLTANSKQNPELFWGLRGGGGNFGIVTSFEFDLHHLGPTVLAGVLLHPADRVTEVMHFYRTQAERLPESCTTIVAFRHVPPLPSFPPSLHGQPVVSLGCCYAGPIEEGERTLRAFRGFGPPLLDLVRPKRYAEHQSMLDLTVPHGLHYYWKSHYLSDLNDEAIAVIARHAWAAPTKESFTIMFQMGGAVRRYTDADSAFSGRNASYAININGVTPQATHFQEAVDWATRFWTAMTPSSTGGVYVNFLGNEGAESVKAAYGHTTYARLAALKKQYDPTNFLRLNQNIRPLV